MSIGAIAGTAGNIAQVALPIWQSGGEREQVIKDFCNKTQSRLALRNPAVRAKLSKLDDCTDAVGSGLFSIVGGMAAGGLAGFAFMGFIPFAPFVLPIAGGFAGNYIYDNAIKEQKQDPIVINQQIIQMRAAGKEVPAEVVFACLAANISGEAGKKIDGICERYTGEKIYTAVLEDQKKIAKLAAMMNNQTVDDMLRAKYQIPLDPQNPNKTVVEQYAELLNSGKLEPQNLLNIGSWQAGFPPVNTPATNLAQSSPEVPLTPMQTQSQTRGT